MVISVVAAVLTQVLGGRLLHMRYDTAMETPGGAFSSMMVIDLGFRWRLGLPFMAGFAAGLICLGWPARKPPRIIS